MGSRFYQDITEDTAAQVKIATAHKDVVTKSLSSDDFLHYRLLINMIYLHLPGFSQIMEPSMGT